MNDRRQIINNGRESGLILKVLNFLRGISPAESGQTPHRASRYFLYLARSVERYIKIISNLFASFELRVLKKARIRATAADPPAKAVTIFDKLHIKVSPEFEDMQYSALGKRRAGLVTGQILVETMVALAMVVIGLLGFLSLLSYSIGLNKVVADQYVATYLASEGIEVIKNIEDNNVANFDPYNTYLSANPGYYEVDYSTQPSGNNGLKSVSPDNLDRLKFDGAKYNYATGDNTPFTRLITVSYPNSPDEMIVQSEVRWTTRGGIQSVVTLEDHFYNWRQ